MGSKMSCRRTTDAEPSPELEPEPAQPSSPNDANVDADRKPDAEEDGGRKKKKKRKRPNQLLVNNNNNRKPFLCLETPTGNMSKIIGETPSGIPMRFVDETPSTPSVKPFGFEDATLASGFPCGKSSQMALASDKNILPPQQMALASGQSIDLKMASPTTTLAWKNYKVIKDFLAKYYTTKIDAETPIEESKSSRTRTSDLASGQSSTSGQSAVFDRKLVLGEKLTPIEEDASEKSITPDSSALIQSGHNQKKANPKIDTTRSQLNRMTICESESSKMLMRSREELYELNMIEFRIKCLKRSLERSHKTPNASYGIRDAPSASFGNGNAPNEHSTGSENVPDHFHGNGNFFNVPSGSGSIRITIKLADQGTSEGASEESYSLETAAALISERKLYLEKRVELETIHCKNVREILRGKFDGSEVSSSVLSEVSNSILSHESKTYEPIRTRGEHSSDHNVIVEEIEGFRNRDAKFGDANQESMRNDSTIPETVSEEAKIGTFYRNLEQEMKDLKTLLFRLQGVMQSSQSDQTLSNEALASETLFQAPPGGGSSYTDIVKGKPIDEEITKSLKSPTNDFYPSPLINVP